MAFRTQASIDPNQHKGLILLNSVTGSPLVATGLSLTNAQPMHVAIVDSSGSQISSFGGGTQYAELTTTAPGTGTLSLGRYKSVAPTLTDGQMYGLQLDNSGNLKVTGSLSVGGTTDNSAYTAGSSTGTPSMGFYHSTIDTVTDGRAATVGITNKRAMFTNLQSSAGTELLAQKTMAGSIPVVLASDQSSIPVTLTSTTITGTVSENLAQVAGGTVSTTGVTGQQKVGIVDSLGNSTNSAGPGFLKTTDEPKQIFYDTFDANPDTTNMWTSTTGSSGVAASVAIGVLSMGTGTVANGYSKFTSIPTFKPTIPGWIVQSDAILIPDAASPNANALRLWGAGTTPATPTLAAPITDGYFFELNGSTLSAVVYAGGTRTQIATGLTLSTTYQRYIIQIRTDRTYFYIGTYDSAGLVATTNFQSPQIQTLPKLFLAVGGATPPASNSQIQCTGAVVSDTGKNATLISDGTFPWRRQTVKAASTAAVATDLPAVVALHPTSPLPAGTASIGNIGTVTTITTLTTLTGTTTLTPGVGATNLGKAEDAAHTSGDVGILTLAVRNDNAATTMTSTNGDYASTSVDSVGVQYNRPAPSNTPGLTNVAGSITSVTALAANAARRLAVFYNDSTSDCYLKFGTTASSTSYTLYLPSLGTTTFNGEDYAGIVTAIWISATGNLRVTETTT